MIFGVTEREASNDPSEYLDQPQGRNTAGSRVSVHGGKSGIARWATVGSKERFQMLLDGWEDGITREWMGGDLMTVLMVREDR